MNQKRWRLGFALWILLLGCGWERAGAQAGSGGTPPPSTTAVLGAAELEKLVAPIALYPDPLVATLLPASAYPLEIVQAARLMKDPQKAAQVQSQPWDKNVKELTQFPDVLTRMDTDLNWTTQLGQAFVNQPQDVMDAIQAFRRKAQEAGTLKTTPQQVIIVTNAVVEKTYQTQIVYVTNTVVQIQPSNPQVIYVPTYSPTVVTSPPPSSSSDAAETLLTFGMGIALGAVIANNCDWHYGGVYWGPPPTVIVAPGRPPYYPPPPGYRPPPYYPPPGYRPPPPGYRPPGVPPPGNRPPAPRVTTTGTTQRWQPDTTRLGASGQGPLSPSNLQNRGWPAAPSAPGSGAVGARPSTLPGQTTAPGARPGLGTPVGGPAPSQRLASTPSYPGGSRPVAAPAPASRDSAFSGYAGGNRGGNTRDMSNRGASSRGAGVGAGRGGGGGRGRR